MANKKRLRGWALSALVVALLVPAGLATGSGWKHKNKSEGGNENVVLLTLGKRDHVKWGKLTQGISSKGGCNAVRIDSKPDILGFAAGGGHLTLKDDGFGVKGKKANGCDTADKGESISVTMGTALDGLIMSAIDVDLELDNKAKVHVSFRQGGNEVASDQFSPRVKKSRSNFRYFNRPSKGGSPVLFDEVVFTAKSGSFSLEGGDDQKKSGYGKLDKKSKASQFEVVPAFDGEITCQDTIAIADPNVTTVVGQVTMHAMGSGSWQTDDCQLKFYNEAVTPDMIAFLPSLTGMSARYTMDLTIHNQPIEVVDGVIVSLGLTYDATGDPNPTRPLLGCVGQPVLGGGGYEAFWSQPDVGLIPAGETACFFQVDLDTTGSGVGTENWRIYFEDDPSFGFK